MLRQPAVAGQFYPGTKQSLQKQVERYAVSGAGKIEAVGIVSPHAGYMYSGAVAGAVLSSAKLCETCVIMGPNHTGRGRPFSIMPEGTWSMPSGDCDIDPVLARRILSGSDYLEEDELAQRGEHSVEVQLPFLQFLKPGVRIVPMVLAEGDIRVYRSIGMQIAAAIKETGPATIIASSDMTHYEAADEARKKDSMAIEAVLALDERRLVEVVGEYGISMCGYAPVCVMIVAAKELGAKHGKLVKYQTSGDITGDDSSVVGYAGIAVY